MTTPQKVLARYLRADAIADPRTILPVFQRVLTAMEDTERQVLPMVELLGKMKKAYGESLKTGDTSEYRTYYREWSSNINLYSLDMSRSHRLLMASGTRLFLALLQQYAIPANKVKKVQAASRFWAKAWRGKRRSTEPGVPPGAENIDSFMEYLSKLREQYALAQDIVDNCKLHSEAEDTKLRAGPFMLINTGNFKPAVMEKVKDVVERAAKALTSAGLGKVCYGDIMVTNTIQRSKTAAFYVIANDEMFVRANLADNHDTLHTVCHELAHRLHMKFLSSKERDIQDLYYKCGRGTMGRPAEHFPTVGQTVEYKGGTYQVLTVSPKLDKITFGEPNARLMLPGSKAWTANLDWWQANIEGVGRKTLPEDFKGYVTTYAEKGGPTENFAEMVAMYALGRLPKPLVELLEAVIR